MNNRERKRERRAMIDKMHNQICGNAKATADNIIDKYKLMSDMKNNDMYFKCNPPVCTPTVAYSTPQYLATFDEPCKAVCCPPKAVAYKNNPTKDDTMYNNRATAMNVTATPLPTDQVQRDYLIDRLSQTRDEQYPELRKQFFMDEDPQPRTRKELAERIAAGKFLISSLDKSPDTRIYSAFDVIEWRDPTKPADEKGFEAALEAREKAYQAAKDAIVINDPTTGLKTLQDFQNWKPTGKAN